MFNLRVASGGQRSKERLRSLRLVVKHPLLVGPKSVPLQFYTTHVYRDREIAAIDGPTNR